MGEGPAVVPLFDDSGDWPRRELAPGAVHVPGWLSLAQQQSLVTACRAWASGPVPIRHRVLPGGGVMSVRSVAIGRRRELQHQVRPGRVPHGPPLAEFPDWLGELGRAAVAAAYPGAYRPAGYRPDSAVVNFYDGAARLGMHQDKDELSDAPVVSLSIGDTCVFRFGNTGTRTRPYTDVELRSGDLFVFGGPARLAFHGVPRIRPGTGDPATGLRSGRLNVTLRETGARSERRGRSDRMRERGQ